MRIDYGPGDRIICIATFDAEGHRGPFPPFFPQVGEVFTCHKVDEHATWCGEPWLHVELEALLGWGFLAEGFKKVPKLPPKKIIRTRKRIKELEVV